MMYLKDGQSIGRAADRARHIQWTTCQQEAVLLLLLARVAQRLEIPQLTNVHAEEGEEVLMEDCQMLADE